MKPRRKPGYVWEFPKIRGSDPGSPIFGNPRLGLGSAPGRVAWCKPRLSTCGSGRQACRVMRSRSLRRCKLPVDRTIGALGPFIL